MIYFLRRNIFFIIPFAVVLFCLFTANKTQNSATDISPAGNLVQEPHLSLALSENLSLETQAEKIESDDAQLMLNKIQGRFYNTKNLRAVKFSVDSGLYDMAKQSFHTHNTMTISLDDDVRITMKEAIFDKRKKSITAAQNIIIESADYSLSSSSGQLNLETMQIKCKKPLLKIKS